MAGGLAPLTTSLTLGVVSGVGPGDRSPSVLAREVTALDVLSSGRSAVLLQLDPAEVPGGVVQAAEAWDRLAEAAAVCRLLFTEEAPTFAGRHFHLAGAANRPGPVRPGGPSVLVQLPMVAPPADPAEVLPAPDAWVVTGSPTEVAAWRQVLPASGPALLWRGELSPGDAAAPDAIALHEAGADGLLVRLAGAGAAPTAEAVASTARTLVPLLQRWAA